MTALVQEQQVVVLQNFNRTPEVRHRHKHLNENSPLVNPPRERSTDDEGNKGVRTTPIVGMGRNPLGVEDFAHKTHLQSIARVEYCCPLFDNLNVKMVFTPNPSVPLSRTFLTQFFPAEDAETDRYSISMIPAGRYEVVVF
ncbi:MAG: hypothetical protein V3U69_06855 [Bacteroidota bacterium]